MTYTIARRFAFGSILLALSACGGGGPQQGGGGGGMGAMPPPLVVAMTVRTQEVPNIVELPGRIQAVRTAEVRARADGIVERRLYQEGTDVTAGQPMFRIDPRDLSQQVEQGRAALARAEAARANAASVVRRYTPLVNERAVSAQEFDQAQATLRQETANVADARAALARSRLQLSYTIVRAPISGRAGRAQVTEGALVSASQATLLATIEQPSPIYAVFTQSNAAILDMRQAGSAPAAKALSQVEVRLLLANGREYGPVGKLDFADQVVDPQTGSQVIRAVFPNAERLLLPGQFIRGRIAMGTSPNGILLPARAVQIGERGASVSVVAKDGSVTTRGVQLGGQTGSNWLIKSGLKAGERIITDGWQKVQPGQKVQIQGDPAPAGQQPQPKQGN
ncbi:efflux RND transporter periplasmic adaptor subunit [Sphingomonas sp. QA11]|uniref:efflux RND transporter periplasmic adaptor subunit n=1 Tax=Sphingomonas sp. QA11 TaxID=2950605 RepID=UPI00234BD0DF|nr:efflux RND transporter periplasmic adaptor subunit [Sphingomonas sp. QA11]WCM26981.1 efflux RND transporter periplasmic adaptor subunit [Sphingomonas sp. QA11]